MAEHASVSKTQQRPTELSAPEPVVEAEAPAIVGTAPALAGLAVRRRAEVADPLGGSAASGDVVEALRRRQGAGAPLAPSVAASFGEALGADLSAVRVHTDSEASTIARSVQATAFTHGSDVYFSQGTFDPATTAGQHLLGHELTHVVQHQTGQDRPSGGTTIGRADDPLERAADESASRVVGALRRRTAGAEKHQHAPGCGHDRPEAAGIQRSLAPQTILRKGKKGEAIDTSKVGPRIAKGHAYQKHVVDEQQFVDLGIASAAEFAKHIDDVLWDSTTESRLLGDGRQAFWHPGSGTVIIYNPNAVDDGTCFRPRLGKAYYDGLT